MNFAASLVVGAIFGLLAGACAFVIAYSEYKRNWAFHGNAVHASLRTAAVTFVFFFLAALLLPWLFATVAGFGRVIADNDVIRKIHAAPTGTTGAYGTETPAPPIKIRHARRRAPRP